MMKRIKLKQFNSKEIIFSQKFQRCFENTCASESGVQDTHLAFTNSLPIPSRKMAVQKVQRWEGTCKHLFGEVGSTFQNDQD